MSVKMPSVVEVAQELENINISVDSAIDVQGEPEGVDVRLQVYPDGAWTIHSGSSDYDQDHRGYWGASSVPGLVNGVAQEFDSAFVAKDLIDQCAEEADMDGAEVTEIAPYWTVIVPSVPAALRTPWHPTERGGKFDPLTRGSFSSEEEAIGWAKEHLNGMPYSVREIPGVKGE